MKTAIAIHNNLDQPVYVWAFSKRFVVVRMAVFVWIFVSMLCIGLGVGSSTKAHAATPSAEETQSAVSLSTTISVDSDATGAEVYIDDMRVGVVPLLYYPIRAGEHKIRVRIDGRAPAQTRVEVKAEQDTYVQVVLGSNRLIWHPPINRAVNRKAIPSTKVDTNTAYTTMALGAASLLIGTGISVFWWDKYDEGSQVVREFQETGRGTSMTAVQYRLLQEEHDSLYAAMWGSALVGVALVGVGAVWWQAATQPFANSNPVDSVADTAVKPISPHGDTPHDDDQSESKR